MKDFTSIFPIAKDINLTPLSIEDITKFSKFVSDNIDRFDAMDAPVMQLENGTRIEAKTRKFPSMEWALNGLKEELQHHFKTVYLYKVMTAQLPSQAQLDAFYNNEVLEVPKSEQETIYMIRYGVE